MYTIDLSCAVDAEKVIFAVLQESPEHFRQSKVSVTVCVRAGIEYWSREYILQSDCHFCQDPGQFTWFVCRDFTRPSPSLAVGGVWLRDYIYLSMYHLPRVCRTLLPEIRVCPEMLHVFRYIDVLTCVWLTTGLSQERHERDWSYSCLPWRISTKTGIGECADTWYKQIS